MQKVVPDAALDPGQAPLAGSRPVALRPKGIVGRVASALARANDQQLAVVLGIVLFVVAAWPLALVRVPPLQDLPNHLATTTVIEHPGEYPELIFNGFLKTNSALFAWLYFVGRLLGAPLAAKLFTLVVLALGAFAYPQFVLAFCGRRKMVVSTFFVWPLVHDWFVSAGMLDFALGVPLSVFLLVNLEAQRRRATFARGTGVAALSLLTWYAHVFPLLVVHMLVVIEVALQRSWSERWRQARGLVGPLLASSVLVLWSSFVHFTEPAGAMTGYVTLGQMLPPWELFYNLWAEWFYGFTWLEIATLVPCLGMGLWAFSRWRDDVPFFGPAAFVVLGVFYFTTPYVATHWFHVNSRFIPFLWLAAIVRLPERMRMPRRSFAALGACALSYTAGMGVDYVRLDRDWARFTAGMDAVPEGAKLLPLIFRSKATSQNTRSMLHAWGFYVLRKHTSAPLLFAHSRSFPVMYREPPPPQFNHLVLESFAPSMASPEWLCGVLRSGGVSMEDGCEGLWRTRWAAFWRQARPRFDHILMWGAPPAVMALVPHDYRVVYRQGELTILLRGGFPSLPAGHE